MRPLAFSPGASKVLVLDADPDLAGRIPHDQLDLARQRFRARTEVLEAGRWGPGPEIRALFGVLVLEGLVCRSVTVANRRSAELIGAGDVLRPSDSVADDAIVSSTVDWRVLERTRLAILDERVGSAMGAWPQIMAMLLERAIQRARSQAVFAAISHMTRVDARLLLAFSHFAGRWGRVTRDGLAVRLPVTHETIGTLIGARRPSVTSALGTLSNDGLLKARPHGEWLLTHRASARLHAVGTASALAA